MQHTEKSNKKEIELLTQTLQDLQVEFTSRCRVIQQHFSSLSDKIDIVSEVFEEGDIVQINNNFKRLSGMIGKIVKVTNK